MPARLPRHRSGGEVVATGSTFDLPRNTSWNGVRVDLAGVRRLRFQPRGQARLADCDIANLSGKDLITGPVTFERCRFENVSVTTWLAFEASFVECTFLGNLTGVVLHGRDVTRRFGRRNVVRSNDFSQAVLRDCDFRAGADVLSNTFAAEVLTHPDVVEVRDRLNERQAEVSLRAREALMTDLSILESLRASGQREFYADLGTYESTPEGVEIFQLLREICSRR